MPQHFVIPNFVDTARFCPASADERAAARAHFGLPQAAFAVGDVAAVKRGHKRIDYLIREAAAVPECFLLIAGARTDDSDELVGMAEELCAGRVKFLFDLSHADMPRFYHCLDVFCHTALFEMMPVALLEALASGLPVLHHEHPVMNWMVGTGGCALDLTQDGSLAKALAGLRGDTEQRSRMSATARARAEAEFSRPAVAARIVEMYGMVAR